MSKPEYIYTDYDRERFPSRAKMEGAAAAKTDLFGDAIAPEESRRARRSPFIMDRDRVIHSTAFRRLQGKTQVFLAGEYDFYRTRLTHSMEVAQIGRAITHHLNESYFPSSAGISSEIVEAACLAHDMGNPPLGHPGEDVLNEGMALYGGFEGNAQTVRELTRLAWRTGEAEEGLRPTRAFLDAVLKYKRIAGRDTTGDSKFLFPHQIQELEWVYGGAVPPEIQKITAATNEALTVLQTATESGREAALSGWKEARARLTGIMEKHRSVEAQIMDWADNTAYCLFDISDGVRGGFIDEMRVRHWLDQQDHLPPGTPGHRAIQRLADVLRCQQRGDRNALSVHLAMAVGAFIRATSLHLREGDGFPPSSRYVWRVEIKEEMLAAYDAFKNLSRMVVFESSRIVSLRHKTSKLLTALMRELMENYQADAPEALVPDSIHHWILRAESRADRMRRLCDTIAGMTDDYLIRSYRRLFEAGAGSVADLA